MEKEEIAVVVIEEVVMTEVDLEVETGEITGITVEGIIAEVEIIVVAAEIEEIIVVVEVAEDKVFCISYWIKKCN